MKTKQEKKQIRDKVREKIKEIYSKRILDILKERDVGLTEFSKAMGVSRQYVHQTLNGGSGTSPTGITITKFVEMCMVLNVSPGEILDEVWANKEVKQLKEWGR